MCVCACICVHNHKSVCYSVSLIVIYLLKWMSLQIALDNGKQRLEVRI